MSTCINPLNCDHGGDCFEYRLLAAQCFCICSPEHPVANCSCPCRHVDFGLCDGED